MRKLAGLTVAAALAAAVAMPSMASAQSSYYNDRTSTYAAPVGGAIVGTAVGVGLYNGWYGGSALATSAGATVGSSIVFGGVAGVGAVALIDAAVQPCRGFAALFGANKSSCANGEYVGYQQQPRRMR